MDARIAAGYGLALAMMFIALTIRVVKGRYRAQVSLGDGGYERLQRDNRAHGNFAEQVPLALLLIALAEINGAPAWAIHVLGIALLLARLSHAYAIIQGLGALNFRKLGMLGTFLVLIVAGILGVVGA